MKKTATYGQLKDVQVTTGNTVSVIFDTGTTLTVTIKTSGEIDPKNCVVSHESPIGKALLNRCEGEEFQYTVGDRKFSGKILKVFYS